MEATTAITLDEAGREVWSLNADRQTQGASTVKTVSTFIARQFLDADETIEVLPSDDIYVPVVLRGGDVARVDDMIYSTILPSDNFAANALARIAGRRILAGEGVASPTPAEAIARFATYATDVMASRGWSGHLIVDGSGVDESSHFTMRQIADHFRRLRTEDPWLFGVASSVSHRFRVSGARDVAVAAWHSARTYGLGGWIGGKTGTMLNGTAYLVWSWRHPSGQVMTSALGESTREARPGDAAEVMSVSGALVPVSPYRFTGGSEAVLRWANGDLVGSRTGRF